MKFEFWPISHLQSEAGCGRVRQSEEESIFDMNFGFSAVFPCYLTCYLPIIKKFGFLADRPPSELGELGGVRRNVGGIDKQTPSGGFRYPFLINQIDEKWKRALGTLNISSYIIHL